MNIMAIIMSLFLVICPHVEILHGVVVDEARNGMLYNGDPIYNYISYKGLPVNVGDEITTLNIIRTEDDIIYRADFW